MTKPSLPLSHYRIVDLTNVLSGPMCCQQLAFLGADVIKVEKPAGGDLSRRLGVDRTLSDADMGVSFLGQNAGKRSITLDLKQEPGKQVLRRLVKTADVLVENFRPGVMDRLGINYRSLETVNSRLVYCAISGFGQTGPLSQLPTCDQIVQGVSGIMEITGDADSAPLRVGYPVADTIAGLTAAFAITAALAGRNRQPAAQQVGCMIDVSILESTLTTMGWVISNWLMAGQRPAPLGNTNFTASPSGTFSTGDGLLNIAANRQSQFEALCQTLQADDLIEDDRFADRYQRLQHRTALTELLEVALSGDSALNWQRRLKQTGVPCGCVFTVKEIFAHEQVRQRDLVQSFEGTSPARVVKPGFLIDDHRPDANCPPPQLGEDTDDILAELGYGQDAINLLRAEDVIL